MKVVVVVAVSIMSSRSLSKVGRWWFLISGVEQRRVGNGVGGRGELFAHLPRSCCACVVWRTIVRNDDVWSRFTILTFRSESGSPVVLNALLDFLW